MSDEPVVNTPDSIARQIFQLCADSSSEAECIEVLRSMIEHIRHDAREEENLAVGKHLAATSRAFQEQLKEAKENARLWQEMAQKNADVSASPVAS